jgi:hypothetical protein
MAHASCREVFMLIGRGSPPSSSSEHAHDHDRDVVLWSDASDSPVALPDSRARWEAIWSRRDAITEIAHSHPAGPLAFSHEDDTTMAALVTALGRPLVFSVVAPRGMVRCTKRPNEDHEVSLVESEPWWASLLRLASAMPLTAAPPQKTPQEE